MTVRTPRGTPRRYAKTTRSAKPAPAKPALKSSGSANRAKGAPARPAAPRRNPQARTTPARKPILPQRGRLLRNILEKIKPPSGSPQSSAINKVNRSRPPAVTGKPSAEKTAAARSDSSSARKPAQPGTAASPFTVPSLDRRLDIIGVVLVFVGFVTVLLLLSSNHDTATGSWLWLLWRAFGWAAYLFPFTLLGIGGWLIIRNFERVPWPSVERLIGIVLLFLNITTELAFLFGAGGVLGAMINDLLTLSLGSGGSAVVLMAWLLVAVTFSLDITVAELFAWVQPLVMKVQDVWDDFRTRNGATLPKVGSIPGGGAPTLSMGPEAGTAPQGNAAPAVSVIPNQPHQWILPAVDAILEKGGEISYNDEFDRQRAHTIEETLASFSAPVNVVEINRGPAITQFGVEPDFLETRAGRTRVRVGKITALADDLALALAARTIRVQAPVPGKGYVGIEVPNEEIARVALRDVIESEAFNRLKSPLRFALGQDVAGNAVAAALDAMPHLLVAGATGSGKSVCVNSLICCFLMHNTPDDLRLVMVDPKRVELTGYNYIPHLLAPVVVEMDRVTGVLQWVLREMDNRYHKLAQLGARNITEYNNQFGIPGKPAPAGHKKLPRLVVFIDELADLMMLAPDETEKSLTRLAQLSRATGIHLVIATQRPSVDVVTGLIKANFPARIAFAVASGTDSRVILDQPGAERLLGRGDMLFQAPDAPAPIRIQGAFLSDVEIQTLVQFWRQQSGLIQAAPTLTGGVVDAVPMGIPLKQMPLWEEEDKPDENKDPLFDEAVDLSRRQGRASITMLQRRLRIGYTRSARLIESMQEKKIISTESTSQGFEILDYGDAAPPIDE